MADDDYSPVYEPAPALVPEQPSMVSPPAETSHDTQAPSILDLNDQNVVMMQQGALQTKEGKWVIPGPDGI